MRNDFNGDGYGDLALGAPGQHAPVSREGAVYVYYGLVEGLRAEADLVIGNPAAQSGGRFGDSAAAVGDIDGDGFADLLVGAPGQDNPTTDEGNAFLFLGGASGVSAEPAATIDSPSNQSGAEFGRSLAAVGDVDGDGYSDLLISAPRQGDSAMGEGAAFLYYGTSVGVAGVPSLVLRSGTEQANAYFGDSLAGVGDLDGDGYVDFAVGEPNRSRTASFAGAVYIYLGGSRGISERANLILYNPVSGESGRFGVDVSIVSDLDGDGYSDLVVGASSQSVDASEEGAVYVFYGRRGELPSSPDEAIENPTNQLSGHFGQSVCDAGDLNGDGFAELIVGAPDQSDFGDDEGKVFVYLGDSGGVRVLPDIDLSHPLRSGFAPEFGMTVGGVSDLDGDGNDDLCATDPGLSVGAMSEGSAFVYLGTNRGVSSLPDFEYENPDNLNGGAFGSSVAR